MKVINLKYLLVLLLLLVFCFPSLAQEAVQKQVPGPNMLFGESWNNLSYYDTNLEKKGFAGFLARFEGKVGLNVLDYPVQAYTAYYGVTSQSPDYWDNSLFYGLGLRVLPFRGYQARGWQDEWIPNVKIYVEALNATYLKNAASAESAGLAKTDTRYGIEVWHEWNLDNPKLDLPWAEIWSKADYRTTNFGWEDFTAGVVYLQAKLGRHLGRGVEPYLRFDCTYSTKSGPDYSFLNIADYGVGIRFEPFRAMLGKNDFMRKFKMFVELVSVSYLKDKPTDPSKQVSSDMRFGIDFSFGR